MSTEDECGYVFYTDLQLFSDKSSETRGVEYTGHANHPITIEFADAKGSLSHRIQRIRAHNENRIRNISYYLAHYILLDLVIHVEQVIVAHTGFAGYPSSNDDYV